MRADHGGRSRVRTLSYYVVGSLLVVFILFAAVELATRTVSWARGGGFTLALHELDPYDSGIENIYQWHPFTGFTFRPNSVVEGSHPSEQKKALVVVDRYGFLAGDHELSFEKADNEVRIVTIGASTTASLNLTFNENWPGKLGLLLQQALPSQKIRVINAAVPGFDTAQSIGNLALRVMPFRPDVVIIYHAYNDLKAIRAERPFSPDYSHIHRRPYGYHDRPFFFVRWLNGSMFYVRARNKYRQMTQIISYRDRFKNDRRLSDIPAEAERAFEQHLHTLIAIARAGGAQVVLSSFATLHDPTKDYTKLDTIAPLSVRQQHELDNIMYFTPGLALDGIFKGITRYNAVLLQVAKKERTGWVDNARLIPHSDEYFVDRVHLSRAGAARMAENFLPVVLEQLRMAQHPPATRRAQRSSPRGG
jgi:lysophospholipase L1-like esterase